MLGSGIGQLEELKAQDSLSRHILTLLLVFLFSSNFLFTGLILYNQGKLKCNTIYNVG